MSIRDDQREKVVERLAEHVLETGLGQTSLRQLARAAGVSDRMLLYYFTDKAEVLSATMVRIAARIANDLDAALPAGVTLAPAALLQLAAGMTAAPEMRRFMRLWVEMIAAAAREQQPYVSIAQEIMASFRQLLVPRLDVPEAADKSALAGAIIAFADGLALIDICSNEGEMRDIRRALPVLFGHETAAGTPRQPL